MSRLLLLLALLFSTSAFAQSAEETVAYVFYEAEVGGQALALLNGVTDGSPAELVSSSPALFRTSGTSGGKKMTFFLEVKQFNSCRYSLRLYTDEDKEGGIDYVDMSFSTSKDFSKTSCIVLNTGSTCKVTDVNPGCVCEAEIVGRCSSKDDRTCSQSMSVSFLAPGATRIKNALAHFRDNICKGRAF